MEWGGDGKGEISLQATWDQGGRDPITPRSFQVSKREVGLEKEDISKGSKKQGVCAIIVLSVCIHVYNDYLNVEYS